MIFQAIEERDFESFADLTMRDSNQVRYLNLKCKSVCFPPFPTKNNSVSFQLHAVCLDTTPPCVYMNDVSHSAQDLVHAINQRTGKKVVNCGNYDFFTQFSRIFF